MEKKLIITTAIISILLTFFYILPYHISNRKILTRPIWHQPKKLIDFELDGPQTSQQVLDIYSLSHITHGILFYFLIQKINIPFFKKNGLYIAIVLELIWEIFENTPYIINKYRKKEEYKEYKGDSIANIIGDTLFMIFGYYLAHKSYKYALLYLIISEILLIPFKANFLHLSFGSLLKN